MIFNIECIEPGIVQISSPESEENKFKLVKYLEEKQNVGVSGEF